MIEDKSRSGQTEVSDGNLNLTRVYRILGHAKRRALLDVLARYDASLALADAAEAVVRLNSATPDEEIARSAVKKCSISLYHRHVPILADGGFVTVENDETLRLTQKGEQLFEAQLHLDQRNPDYL